MSWKEGQWLVAALLRRGAGKKLNGIHGVADMSRDGLVLRFADTSVAEGNRLAASLTDALRNCDPSVTVDRQRERPDTQDFGTSLSVILGTAAVNAVAKGIASWLQRNSGAKIELRRGNTLVMTATHLDSADVPKLAEALARLD